MQKYYQNEPRFNGAFSRDNLQKIKDGAYIINLDDISHEEFITILKEKYKYERMKDNLISENENTCLIRIVLKQCIKLWLEKINNTCK